MVAIVLDHGHRGFGVAQCRNGHGGGRLTHGPLRRGGTENLLGNPVLLGHPPAANLRPHVVSAASGHDSELLARKSGRGRQLILHRAELVERVLQFDCGSSWLTMPLTASSVSPRWRVHLAGRRHDVRLVAGVHDERFAVDVDDRLEERRNETHFTHGLHTLRTSAATGGRSGSVSA